MRLDAYPDRSWTGTVLQVGSEAILSQGRSAYEVTVGFDAGQEVPAIIRMGADVEISGPAHAEVLAVPSRAVISIGGKTYVEVVRAGGQVERVPVEVGITAGNQTEVLSGLSAGETIRIP